jgi:cupredoxin-like protein
VMVVVGMALAWLGRPARRGTPAPAATAAGAPVSLVLEVRDGEVSPARLAVPKSSRVSLSVVNRGSAAVRFALAGYEDRVSAAAVAPGSTWRCEFVADRPGEDLAWLVDGRPAATLAVSGSHLEEGRR